MIPRVVLWALRGLGALLVLAAVVWLVWKLPPALYGYVPDPKDRAGAESTTRTGILAGLAGLAALGSLTFTARTYRLSLHGQLTDRYTKAVAQLGDDKLDIRLGGIYALERLAVDSPRDHRTIVEVLSAFVRERTKSRAAPRRRPSDRRTAHPLRLARSTEKLTEDVQAALTVLGGLPRRRGVHRARLSGANLTRASLVRADLAGADLSEANLTEAWLVDANLAGALLYHANLTDAWLGHADLTAANLTEADLTEAMLRFAKLARATLWRANLTKVDLEQADLTRAELREANLTEAWLAFADLARSRLIDVNLTGAVLLGADLSRAQIVRADLTGAEVLRAALAKATLDDVDLTTIESTGKGRVSHK